MGEIPTIEKSFQECTWEDVYTQIQKEQMISKVSKLLEELVQSPEAHALIKCIGIAKYDTGRGPNQTFALYIGPEGLMSESSMGRSAPLIPYKIYSPERNDNKPIPNERFPKTIEDYKLDYNKLEPLIKAIHLKIK